VGVGEDRFGRRNVLPWIRLCYGKLNVGCYVVRSGMLTREKKKWQEYYHGYNFNIYYVL
jgi:hypothetical protein